MGIPYICRDNQSIVCNHEHVAVSNAIANYGHLVGNREIVSLVDFSERIVKSETDVDRANKVASELLGISYELLQKGQDSEAAFELLRISYKLLQKNPSPEVVSYDHIMEDFSEKLIKMSEEPFSIKIFDDAIDDFRYISSDRLHDILCESDLHLLRGKARIDHLISAKRIWDDLSNVPVDYNGMIEEPFRLLPSGTSVEVVWRWIEDTHPSVSVAEDLMYTAL